jgi:hypothetical protein
LALVAQSFAQLCIVITAKNPLSSEMFSLLSRPTQAEMQGGRRGSAAMN